MTNDRSRKILISLSRFAEFDKKPLEELQKNGCGVIMNPHGRTLSKGEVIALLKDGVNGTIAGLEPLDADVLKQSTLRVISRCGSGMSNVDLKAAQAQNIIVCSTPLAPVNSVAELTVGSLISLLRHVVISDAKLRAGQWTKMTGTLLEGKTILIIGMGHIGRRVAELLKAFSVKILVCDPFLKDKIDGVKIVNLAEGLALADIVTCHCSGSEQIIGAPEFSLMRKGVYILNAARGEVINEEALIDNLQSGKVKGAWLDTFESEPYQGPLKNFEQVILTPHMGSYTLECRKNMEMQAVRNLLDAFEGKHA